MKRYCANQPAPYGLYISARAMDVRFVGSDGESLGGRDDATYRRLPTWALALLAPALGGAFVLAFPLLVVAAVIGTLAVTVARAFGGRHAYVARSTWQPAAAYFDGKSAPTEPTAGDDVPELAALEAEVAVKADAEKRDA